MCILGTREGQERMPRRLLNDFDLMQDCGLGDRDQSHWEAADDWEKILNQIERAPWIEGVAKCSILIRGSMS